MINQLSTILLCGLISGLLAFANICAADNDRATVLTISIGNLFSKPYLDINDMLSAVQQVDLDRVDWVDPKHLIRLQQAPDQLNELAAVLNNLKFFTDTYNKLGPWTVTKKSPLIVPNGDNHQYLSWARYFWPVNSTIPNTSNSIQKRTKKRDTTDYNEKPGDTATTDMTSNVVNSKQAETSASTTGTVQKSPENSSNQKKISSASDAKQSSPVASTDQGRDSEPVPAAKSSNQTFPEYCSNPDAEQDKTLVWKNCPYENRDGKTNPDIDLLNDAVALRSACRAAFLNAVLYVLTGETKYGKQSSSIIRYFFLNPETSMRPEIKYGQIIRGPARNGSDNDWTIGTFRGLVDSRHLIKAWNAVIILRGTKCSSWGQTDDLKMREWTQQFSDWLLNDVDVSIIARSKKNNIKSWWYTQAIASNILIENQYMTNALIDKYFLEDFIGLIDARGDQPYETNRTRPAHYRAFGIEPMIVNARLSAFVGKNEWNAKSNVSTTINDAIKFDLAVATQNSTMIEKAELAPHIATALAVYGDTNDQIYQKYLDNNEAFGDIQKNATWRLFNRPAAFSRI